MGTFSPAHWIIAIALMAGAAALIYFVGSLMWAGAKASGSKWKLIAVALLIPVAILAVIGFVGASKTPNPDPIDWEKGVMTLPPPSR